MTPVGHVESLWRYPVKSMRGEPLTESFLGFAGVYGDRLFALHSTAARAGFPYLTAREQEQLLLYRPVYRHPEQMAKPPNLAAAEALPPGLTPVYPDRNAQMVDVETPSGEVLAIDDPALLAHIHNGLRDRHELTLLRSDRAMTDCRPVSLFSVATVQQLGSELGIPLDKRRFRANIYIDLAASNGSAHGVGESSQRGFEEDRFVGHTLQIGPKAVIAVLDRDPRCKMINLDPATAEQNPEVMKLVARAHDGKAGVYAAVLVEGAIHPGDEISLLN